MAEENAKSNNASERETTDGGQTSGEPPAVPLSALAKTINSEVADDEIDDGGWLCI